MSYETRSTEAGSRWPSPNSQFKAGNTHEEPAGITDRDHRFACKVEELDHFNTCEGVMNKWIALITLTTIATTCASLVGCSGAGSPDASEETAQGSVALQASANTAPRFITPTNFQPAATPLTICQSANGKSRLSLEQDGHFYFRVYDENNQLRWQSGTARAIWLIAFTSSAQLMIINEIQGDGWGTPPVESPANPILTCQEDGNVVISGSGTGPLWSTSTAH